jgi:flagellar motor switch protein FliM
MPESDTLEEEEAMNAAAEAAAAAPERVLNQDEIDSLLGFEVDEEAAPERHGIDAIVKSSSTALCA